ncbi:MAG: hypothetical protein H6Q38_1052 [Chloroflexi bacterium]|nr:hypothetical protein [Chloroflexota bacterium]
MDSITCLTCGHLNPPDNHKCEICGSPIETQDSPIDATKSGSQSPNPPEDLSSPHIPGEIHGVGGLLGKASLTPAQQAHTRLLKELIAGEGTTPTPPGQPKMRANNLLRIGVGSVIILLILISLLVELPFFSPPELSSETLAARQLIYSLPPGAPVLVAFDYQPAYIGEMSRASQGILAHLMAQQAYLTLISTQPTGPALAELLIAEIGRYTDSVYQAPEQYQNLGYLPGGASGLLIFSEKPHQMTPVTADGEPAWENSEVNQIYHISDFSLVLVITDDPETGRTWIEQIGPKLGDKPLVFVSSAQAAPILQPYYASQPQQLQGLISGVAGGMAYQESALFFLNNNQAGVPWSTYSLALWAGAAIMILGVIVAFIRRMNEEDSEPRSGGMKP